MEADMKQKVLI